MKPANKFEMWIDSSIRRLMELTDEINLTNDINPASGFREETLMQPSHLLAEANDYLSINDWIHENEDFKLHGLK